MARPASPQVPAPKVARNPDGTFVRGASGNPGGRKSMPPEFLAKAKAYSWDALDTLWEMMMDPDILAVARVQAAKELLDRGLGKARESIDVDVDAKGDLASILSGVLSRRPKADAQSDE